MTPDKPGRAGGVSPVVWRIEAILCFVLAGVEVVAAVAFANFIVGLPIAAAWCILGAFFLLFEQFKRRPSS